MSAPLVIKALQPSDIYPEMLADFEHRKVITEKWVKTEGGYKLIKTDEVREWDREKKIWVFPILIGRSGPEGGPSPLFRAIK